MIINSLCNSCLQPFQLLVETGDIELIKHISDEDGVMCDCPRLCGGKINLVGDPVISEMQKDARLKDPMVITGKQLYQAVMGLGLPDEVPKSKELVDSLLRSNSVVSVDIEDDGSGKLFVHEIKLSNQTTIHLASGSRGAQVLKITREKSNDGR